MPEPHAGVARLVAEITEAFARAENTTFDDVAPRVWVFPTEIPDGQWGARGLIRIVSCRRDFRRYDFLWQRGTPFWY